MKRFAEPLMYTSLSAQIVYSLVPKGFQQVLCGGLTPGTHTGEF